MCSIKNEIAKERLLQIVFKQVLFEITQKYADFGMYQALSYRLGSMGFNIIWVSMRETMVLLLTNNKNAEKPAHPRCLISAFVIRYLKSKVTRSDISQFSILLVGFNMIKPLATPLYIFPYLLLFASWCVFGRRKCIKCAQSIMKNNN